MILSADSLTVIADNAPDRIALWAGILSRAGVREMAEVGVQRGLFASAILGRCPGVTRYYMVDPWRHLEAWNKPSNRPQEVHEAFYRETLENTEAFASKRVILRGTTTEVIDRIPDGGLDCAYIDGDHTLRGITIDLARVWPKIKNGGFVGGDDFCPSIWQHDARFEPTLVFPYAVYFAESIASRIYALPFRQFLIEKREGGSFEFIDREGLYAKRSMKDQFDVRPESR